jgi:glycosyltransferase involved in cell wall biosynthesis
MRVQLVDPSAFTPPYDHALAAALARAGAQVELVTSRFAYGKAPAPDGYAVRELFYRHVLGSPGSRLRLASKLVAHVPDMLALRRHARQAEVVHFQWLAVQPVDRHLLPGRPVVLTAHDLLPREPRPGQARAQRRLYDAVDAVVVHTDYGRRQLVQRLGLDATRVHVIHHGAFDYLARGPTGELPEELTDAHGPAVLFFGLLRPYKGVQVLLEAWRGLPGDLEADLWIVGRPRMRSDSLVVGAPPRVRWVTRFVSDPELAACFRRADVVVLPYLRTERFDFSGVLATALAFGKPTILTDVGGFRELAEAGAAELVPAGDPAALARAIEGLLRDEDRRRRLAAAALRAAQGSYSWDTAAHRTLELYRTLVG